jgi:DsbE subfamily thiol:disulfide oxidoreductase
MNRPRFKGTRGGALIACAAAVVAIGLWLLVWNEGSGDPSVHRTTVGMPARVDRPAPDFTRQLLSDHGSFRMGSHPGVVTVVNFWASWCTPCRSETPELDDLWKSYRGQGVRFVGVDYQDHRDAAVKFVRSLHLMYPIVSDSDGKVGDAFGIVGLPTTFIVDPGGRIRYVISGQLHVPSFTSALGSLLAPEASEAPVG